MELDDAIRTRTSIRAFLPDEVEMDLVREVLDVARWSPSGANMQPWKVVVVTGDAQRAATRVIEDVVASGEIEQSDPPIYPDGLPQVYRDRQFEVGRAMYEKLGIPREDKAARWARFAENGRFFGAPVGIFFVIDAVMERNQWAHLGMFMQSVALAAHARGLGTCMQEYWTLARTSLHAHFDLDDDEILYCGMSLGWPDRDAPVNDLRSERIEVDDFTTWLA